MRHRLHSPIKPKSTRRARPYQVALSVCFIFSFIFSSCSSSNPQLPTAPTSSPVTSSPFHPVTLSPLHLVTPSPTYTPIYFHTPTRFPLPTPTPPQLTLDEKLGLLLLVGTNGIDATRETQSLITHYHVGGIVLRGRNVRDAQQIESLIADLQSLAPAPLFIAADQEGGDVTRLTAGVTHFPSAMAIGATNNPDLAYQVGYASAAELLALGVNVNLAPDLDTLTQPANTIIGLRSFGSDPERVSQLGTQFMQGTLAAGVIPVLKHYPDHGGTTTDSHAGLPTVPEPNLLPFNFAIAEGAPAVMLGHLWVPSLDPAPRPASLSPNVIGLLRQSFNGVILTDSLNMGAITNQRTAPEAALRAFLAGADWLLIAEPIDVPPALALLRAAYERGEISPERLEVSVQRLLDLRARLGRDPAPAPDLVSNANLALSVSTQALAVTCAPNIVCAPVIPSDTKKILLLAPNHLSSAPADPDHITYLAQLLSQRGYRVTELLYSLDSSSQRDYPDQAELYAKANDFVLFGAWDAHLTQTLLQTETLRRVTRANKPVIVIGFHLPFDLQVLHPEIYLATFGDTRAQMEALVGALLGEFTPSGLMP